MGVSISNGATFRRGVSEDHGLAADIGVTASPPGDGSLSDVEPTAILDLDATIALSYPGAEQTWANLVTAPADGSTQTQNDFFLGQTGSAAGDDPTFTGAAGDPGAYFLMDVTTANDLFKFKGTITTFFDNIHKTTGGQDFTIGVAFRFVQNDQTQVLFATNTNTTAPGVRIVTNASERVQLIQRGDATAVSATDSTVLVNGTDYLCLISHNHTTNMTTFWVNSATGNAVSHTFDATTNAANSVPSFGAEPDGGVMVQDGTRIYACSAFLGEFDDTKAAAIFSVLNQRHQRTYA